MHAATRKRQLSTTSTSPESHTSPSSMPRTLSEVIAREDPVKRGNMVTSLWQQIDTDRSGFLTLSELKAFLEQLSSSASKKASATTRDNLPNIELLATELLESADTSGDELVGYAEFEDFLLRKEKDLYRIFQETDIDGSGYLSKSEVKEVLEKAGLTVADQDVAQFFHILDKDRSGTLDFYELRDAFFFQAKSPDFTSLFVAYQNVYDPSISIDGVVTATPSRKPTTAGDYTRFYVEGGVAGAISRTLTAPLDRLRTLYQTSLRGRGRVREAIQHLRKAVAEINAHEGSAGFLRGNLLNVAKVVPEIAVTYLSFTSLKALFAALEDRKDPSHLAMFVAGGMSGTLTVASVYPLETLRTRLMVSESGSSTSTSTSAAISSRSAGDYWKTLNQEAESVASKTKATKLALTAKGHVEESGSVILTAARELYQEGGVKAFYRGILPASIGVFPFMAINMNMFEAARNYLTSRGQSDSDSASSLSSTSSEVPILLAAGTVSSTLASLVTYPLQLCRIRMQAQGTTGHNVVYRSSWDCFKQTYREGGVRALYRGLPVSLLKCVPNTSLSFVVYELTRKISQQYGLDV
ncbi:mitochondrial carrier [Gonapodya prolifera JEL478]|uniref:Mitochondrial carrier n=1 Tax=Gonapodya prolifera (strain JEL478) TaxID=1344416 RepID=A0A139AYD3_GONPJ|nr:mitochondrial carrier [Gonapodya prolifera JEL478]|eukprot:KXS21714.1 mitochondrial carrier [Gonapodya prolifera JEL478]